MLQTVTSNAADLNVITQEQNYLRATSAYFQPQGLTANLTTNIPSVTVTAEITVGNGVGDGTLSPDGEPVPPNRCPEVNQFVYIRDENGLLVPARAGDVTVGQFLYNPISDEFEEVINAEIVASELWEVITTEQCKFVGSPTTPLIQTLADVHGLALKDCHIGTKCLAMIDRQLKPTEVRTIVKRKAMGFINHLSTDGPDKIYLAGTRADKVLFIHNKPPNDSLEA